MSLPTLTELGYKYNTDKAYNHKFTDFYDEHFTKFRDKNINLLEIGVCGGWSVRMWEAYFQKGLIYGVDLVDKTQHDTERIKTCIADQENFNEISNVYKGIEFDIIVDDGGHKVNQQIVSFAALFPRLKSGGIYIVEDLHTNTGWYDYEKDPTTLKMLYDMKDRGDIDDVYIIKKDDLMKIYETIDSIIIKIVKWNDSVTSLIYKK